MRRTLLALPLAALLLSGCETLDPGYGIDDGYGAPPSERDGADDADGGSGAAYRAGGTEPFWSLSLDDREIRYEPATGPAIVEPVPEPTPVTNGDRFTAGRLQVTIVERECSDGTGDRRYPDTVTVRVDGRTLYGCGGGDAEEADVGSAPITADADDAAPDRIGGSWRVVSIDGRAARDSTLEFQDGRLTGRSCNRLFGDYRAGADGIDVGQVGSTRMACAPEAMSEERALLDVLRGSLAVRDSGREDVELVGAGGRRIVLAPL